MLISTKTKAVTRMIQPKIKLLVAAAPTKPTMTLPGKAILEKMDAFMAKGVTKGWFKEHNKTTAMEIATIVVNTQSDDPIEVTEQDMYDRERAAFLRLAKTPETARWITAMLAGEDLE